MWKGVWCRRRRKSHLFEQRTMAEDAGTDRGPPTEESRPPEVAREVGGEPPGGREALELVLDDIKDYAVFMVSLEGRIASWNDGAQRVKGYRREEAIGLPFAALFTREDAERGQPEHEMRVALATGVYRGEGVRVRKDGSRFCADVTLRLIADDRGTPQAFVKVTRDITERRRLESVNRERAELEKQLLGIVSHDLRNPLAAILLSAAGLLNSGELEGRQTRALSRIVSSADRAMRLVSDLLDFTQARLGKGLPIKPQPLDASDFLELAVEEVRLAHPGREVVLETRRGGPVTWDPDRVAQLLTNLVRNALEHGAKDKPVRVTIAGDVEGVRLEVRNEGNLIPSDLLPHLFDRLTQGPSAKAPGSIGLGLFIAKQIVVAHGGTIDVESTEATGTTFLVRLPRHAAPQVGGVQPPEAPRPSDHH